LRRDRKIRFHQDVRSLIGGTLRPAETSSDPLGIVTRPRANFFAKVCVGSHLRCERRCSRNSKVSKPIDAPSRIYPITSRQWGEGRTAAEMEKCRWLKPQLVASIEYLEWTAANHRRHAVFAELTQNPGLEPHRAFAGHWDCEQAITAMGESVVTARNPRNGPAYPSEPTYFFPDLPVNRGANKRLSSSLE
jgi:hypothetical protein